MTLFENRRDAGKQLASRLSQYKHHANAIVLGIPRGGIVVADEIAQALHAPLDVMITRKLGAPDNPELAIGAVASDGTLFLDRVLIHQLHISSEQVARERAAQLHEIRRRIELYRRDRPPLTLQNKLAILVDDGIATGATTIAALRALKNQNAARLVLAVPVAPPQVVSALRAECDEVVLLSTPEPFIAVGYFFRDFTQVTDEEVIEILNR